MSDDGSFDFETARLVAEKLESLKTEYESVDGSNNKSMEWVRSKYAEIVPFAAKNWYKPWSKFANDLIELDKVKNRPVFRNKGPVPSRPIESNDDQVYVFDLNDNPIFPDVASNSQRSKSTDHRNKRIHILTQEEINNAQKARDSLDSQNSRPIMERTED
ncbi:hypothetical protein DFH28DRAFT_924713 [Melampsora americana]|nr:hypothetical protein DFH28DRAFT_924713 [Melampsora americana]